METYADYLFLLNLGEGQGYFFFTIFLGKIFLNTILTHFFFLDIQSQYFFFFQKYTRPLPQKIKWSTLTYRGIDKNRKLTRSKLSIYLVLLAVFTKLL